MLHEDSFPPSQTALVWAEERLVREAESDFADMKRAMRRLLSTNQSSPKWVLARTYPLNQSQSKRIMVGLCLERRLRICVSLESSSGLGIKFGAAQLEQLLDRSWIDAVLHHLEEPSASGKVVKNGEFEFRCSLLRNSEPGLRISALNEEKECFVVIGGITIKRLFDLASVLKRRLEFLRMVTNESDKWLVRWLEGMRAEGVAAGCEEQLTDDLAIELVRDSVDRRGKNLSLGMTQCVEEEMVNDIMFCHPVLASYMLSDYTKE